MNRQELEAIWGEVHPDLPCSSPLHAAIISEGLDAATGGTDDGNGDPAEIVSGLNRLTEDIEAFADLISSRSQGLPDGGIA